MTMLAADKHYCVPGRHWYVCVHPQPCLAKSQIPCPDCCASATPPLERPPADPERRQGVLF